MALISISIDIAGSTKIKKTIKDFCSSDPENIKTSYMQFIRQLYNCEMDFYLQLVNHGIDLSNLFVVKTIGDEIWIVLDLTKCKVDFHTPEFNKLVVAVIKGLININYKNYYIVISERKLTKEEENDKKLQESIKFKYLPIIPRVFVDLLENYEEANHIRYEIFEHRYDDLFPYRQPKDVDAKERLEKFPAYLTNLNFGTQIESSDTGKVKIAYRFDPIGFEIDKFFRCTTNSQPGIVSIGENLFHKMYPDTNFNSMNNKGKYDKLKISYGDKDVTSNEYFTCIYKKLSKQDLKGINEDYFLFYLLNTALLPSGMRGKKSERMNYKSTLELLKDYRLKF
jgi:hypothetical protein